MEDDFVSKGILRCLPLAREAVAQVHFILHIYPLPYGGSFPPRLLASRFASLRLAWAPMGGLEGGCEAEVVSVSALPDANGWSQDKERVFGSWRGPRPASVASSCSADTARSLLLLLHSTGVILMSEPARKRIVLVHLKIGGIGQT